MCEANVSNFIQRLTNSDPAGLGDILVYAKSQLAAKHYMLFDTVMASDLSMTT